MIIWWRQWMKVATVIFLFAFLISFLIFGLMFGTWPEAIKVALILGVLAASGISFYLVRDLKRETLEITSANKDSQKSMKWYEDEILSFLRAQRYEELPSHEGKRIFSPRAMTQHMGGIVEVSFSTLAITLTAPRGTVRILASLLDLKKIFL